MKIVIFRQENGAIGILVPTQEALSFASIEQIAEKDVPHNLPYIIVNDTDLPSDNTFRDAWEWDNSVVPDGFGGESNEFDAELLAKYYEGRL